MGLSDPRDFFAFRKALKKRARLLRRLDAEIVPHGLDTALVDRGDLGSIAQCAVRDHV